MKEVGVVLLSNLALIKFHYVIGSSRECMISRMEGKEHRQTLTPEGGDGNRGHSKTSCDGLLNSRPPRGKTSNPSECVMKRPRETGRDHLSEWGRNYQVRGRRAGEDGRGGTTARVIRKWTALGFSRSSFLSSCGNLCPSAERGGRGDSSCPPIIYGRRLQCIG